MSFIEGYLIFAFSTSIAACYIWFWPLVMQAVFEGKKNSLTLNPKLSVMVFVIISAIVAPLYVLPLLSTSYGEAVARGLKKEIFTEDDEKS
jgi:hypothetical protein